MSVDYDCDVINSRDLYFRLEVLREERLALIADTNKTEGVLEDWEFDNEQELNDLIAAEKEIRDWMHGTPLIGKTHIESYLNSLAREMSLEYFSRDVPEYLTVTVDTDVLLAGYAPITIAGNLFWYQVS